jgi:arylsulfatase A-like enzyme
VNLWLDDPHTPWVPRGDAPKGDKLENLHGVLTEMDRQVGRLLDGLRERGLERDTLVIFTSDNGALPTFKGRRSASLRGSKLSLYEGGMRVPFIAYWPGRIPAGRVDKETVLTAVDTFPTFCALAGAALPEGTEFDGENMTAALEGKPVVRRRPLFWEYGRNETSFKFPAVPRDRSPAMAVRDGGWKLLLNADGTGAELYDLTADPGETKNLADNQPAVVQKLKTRVLDWRRSWPKQRAGR